MAYLVCGESPCSELRVDLRHWTENLSPLDDPSSPESNEKRSEERRKRVRGCTNRKPLDLQSASQPIEKRMRFTFMVPDKTEEDKDGDAACVDRLQFANEELKEELKNAKEREKASKERILALERENDNLKRWAAHIVQAGVSMMSGQSGHK